jgi:hypothetical protein
VTRRSRHSAPTTAERFLVIVVAVGCAVALGFTLARGVVRLDVVAAFVALIAVGELLQVRLPGDRPAAPVAASAALGYAMLFAVGGQPVSLPVAQVTCVVALGVILGSLVHFFAGRRPRSSVVARRVVAAVVAGLVFRATAPHNLATLPVSQYKQDLRWVALLMVTVVALAGLADLALAAFVRSSGRRVAFGWMLRDEIGAGAGLWAAVGATGVLMALATPSMKLYALPIFCVPLLLTQFAFRRYAAIRTTYRQTIRSLSRVAEVGGYVEAGHAHRVSSLAVAVGREMGLTESEISDLEYAALLHDIGQLSLTDPIPGGSTLVVAPVERRRVAELGADVIKTTGVLDRVADIVARQADPYRRHREAPDESLPVESRIIKAVSAYDDLVGDNHSVEATADALERLRLGMAYEYDPAVVETLTRIVAA